MKKVFAFFIPAFCFCAFSFAQSLSPTVIASQGSYSSDGNISLQWTMGEVFVETVPTRSVVFTEGFNQPEMNFDKIVSNQGNSNGLSNNGGDFRFTYLDVSVFPNPFQAYLKVTINSSIQSSYEVTLVDLNGMILKQTEISSENPTVTLDVRELPAAVYMIQVHGQVGTGTSVYRVFKFK